MRRAALFAVCFLATALPWLRGQKLTLPLKPDSVRFVVIGDMGNGQQPEYDVAHELAEVRKKFPFDFVVTAGDNIYGGDTPLDFEMKFERPYKPLLKQGVEFYASYGNHDHPALLAYKPFHMDGRRYYTFQKGNVRFFILDSNDMDSEQLAWAKKELARPGESWKICVFHHPLYSAAAFHGPAVALREMLEPIFVEHGVNLVFSGHDHVYERVKPQKGIYYFTEGASGQLRFGNLRHSREMAAGFDQDCSFMLIEIAGDDMFFDTVSRTGATVDSGVIGRNSR